MTKCIASISCLTIVLTATAFLVPTSSAFWVTRSGGLDRNSLAMLSPFDIMPGFIPRRQKAIPSSLPTAVRASVSSKADGADSQQLPPPRQEATIRLAESGREATLVSRTLPVFANASITVWEFKNSAKVVNAYWDAQGQAMATLGGGNRNNRVLDPFGLVSWPGSVLAARELHKHAEAAVRNRNVVVFGAGVGVETQAAAMLGPKSVVATDIHPTTLQQLELGVSRNDDIPENVVRTRVLDLFLTKEEQPIPSPCDLLVVADVLYSEQLAFKVCHRCAEALEANPKIKILITDSQRFVPTFIGELNEALQRVRSGENPPPPISWTVETMKNFEGSGVIIDEDQTYDVTVQSLWIGL